MKNPGFLFIFSFFCAAQPAPVDDVIESCLMKIIKKYFLKKSALLMADLTAEHHQPLRGLLPDPGENFHQQIIAKLMKKLTLQLCDSNSYLGLPAKLRLDKPKNCLLFIRPDVIDREVDKLHSNPLWDPTGRNLVVVRAGATGNDSEALARRIIERLWTNSKAVNNLVMVAQNDATLQLYTWFPYRQPDCSQVRQVVRLDTYAGGRFLQKSDLFPAKIGADLQGCELRAATDTCIPYVFADTSNSTRFVSGLEINIIEAISRNLNFRLSTVRPRDMWTTSVNGSLTGAFKMLEEQKVELAFSCLMLNQERYLLALALPSYYEDSLVWFVPSPSFTTHASDIVHAFSTIFWVLMISVMLTSAVLVGALSWKEYDTKDRRAREVVGNVVKLIGISLYCPVEIPTKSYTFRLFIFVLCLYSMHITIAFQSSLFALFQLPHYNVFYSSLDEAVESGLFVYLRSSSEELYNQSDHDLWNKIMQPGRFDYLTDFGEVFSEIAFDKSAVALFIKTTGIYMISVYFTDESGSPQIFWLPEKFAPYPVTIFLSPGNPLFPRFEKQLHRLLASGLVRLWLTRSVFAQDLYWPNEEFVNNPLSMVHLAGAFFVLVVLSGVATCAFLGELLTFHLSKRAKVRRKPKHRHFFLPDRVRTLGGELFA